MANGEQAANDIPEGKVKTLLGFVEDNRKKKRSVRMDRADKGECWSLPV